jgi:hypothetical protein
MPEKRRARQRLFPETVMGAGIAAGPHCPCAGSWPGRRGVPRGAVSSRRRLKPGVPAPLSPGSWIGRSRSRFPRGLPVRAEALAVRRSADQELSFQFPPFRHPGRSQHVGKDGILGRSLGSAWQSMSRSPGSCRGRSSGPKPGPARQSGAEAPSRRWRRADRSPAFRRTSPPPEGPVSRPFGFPAHPKAAWFNLMGA